MERTKIQIGTEYIVHTSRGQRQFVLAVTAIEPLPDWYEARYIDGDRPVPYLGRSASDRWTAFFGDATVAKLNGRLVVFGTDPDGQRHAVSTRHVQIEKATLDAHNAEQAEFEAKRKIAADQEWAEYDTAIIRIALALGIAPNAPSTARRHGLTAVRATTFPPTTVTFDTKALLAALDRRAT